jgi:UDPglucose 6-dehydrogenase
MSPTFDGNDFFNSRVISDLAEFKAVPDVIVANRLPEEIKDVEKNLYSRPFGQD